MVMALEHESNTALAKAVRCVGNQSAFGRLLNKRQSVVSGWLKAGRPLPAEFVLRVEAATGVSRHDLRPDLYPREPVTLSNPAEATSAETVPAASSPASPAPIGDQAGGGRDNTFKGGVPVT